MTANIFCPNCAAIVRATVVTVAADGRSNYAAWLCRDCMLPIRAITPAELEAA